MLLACRQAALVASLVRAGAAEDTIVPAGKLVN